MMKKTLKLIEQAYSLLEATPFPEAGGDAGAAPAEGSAPDPTMVDEPQAPEQPEVQKLTSQGEVNMIKKLITLLQTVVTSEPDETTRSMIVNFDVDSIDTTNARDMLKKFETSLVSNKSDYETTSIDNKYGL